MVANNRSSTISNKYPTYRDDIIRGCWSWLDGKQLDDNAEGLWRVHDKLYNLTDFIDRHPGGKEWLVMTKGVDITEQFESYHITDKASQVLKKYYIRDATQPRNYKLTFEENGFYKTLKRRVAERLKTIDKTPATRSKIYFDVVLILLIMCAGITAYISNTNLYMAFTVSSMTSVFISMIIPLSHNFIHQANNWRMRMCTIAFNPWRDFRVFHGLSHHMYPNTFHDMEVFMFEPWNIWIPQPKSSIMITISYIIIPFVYTLLFFAVILLNIVGIFKTKRQIFHFDDLIAVALPIYMMFFVDLNLENVYRIFIIWIYMIGLAGFLYSVVAVNAGHHGPTITHEGDELRSLDFGIFQIGATLDRVEADHNEFTVLIGFGNHIMHHMLPALDHGLLPQLKDCLIQTCLEFDCELRKFSFYDGVKAQLQQLRRTETNKLK